MNSVHNSHIGLPVTFQQLYHSYWEKKLKLESCYVNRDVKPTEGATEDGAETKTKTYASLNFVVVLML